MIQPVFPEPLPKEGLLFYLNTVIVWGGLLFGISSLMLALHGIISSKKKSRPPSLVALAWLVMVFGVVFLSSFLLQTLLSPTRSRLSNERPTRVILDQVYRNKAYGIELRYPSTWSLKDNTSEFHPIDIEFSSPDYKEKPLYGEAMGGRMVTSGGVIVLSDYGVPNVDYQGIRSFDGLKSKRAEETKWRGLDITETTVDGHNALYEFTQDQDVRILQEAFIFGMPDLPSDLPVLRFKLESLETDETKFSDIFLRMLGTLRFIGSNTGSYGESIILPTKVQTVTPEKAAQLVQNLPEVQAFLRRVDPSGKVDFEGDVEGKNAYLIHVYELLSDHTATFNWYEVDKVTGEVRA